MSYPSSYRGGAARSRSPLYQQPGSGNRRPRVVRPRPPMRLRPPLKPPVALLRPPAVPAIPVGVNRVPGFAGIAGRAVARAFWPVSLALFVADVLPHLRPFRTPVPMPAPGNFRRVKGPHVYSFPYTGSPLVQWNGSSYTTGDGRITQQSVPSPLPIGTAVPSNVHQLSYWWPSLAPVGNIAYNRFAQQSAWRRIGSSLDTLPAADPWPVWARPAPQQWPGLEPWAPSAFPEAFPPGLAAPLAPTPPAIAREIAKANPESPTAPVRYSPPNVGWPVIAPTTPTIPNVTPEPEAPSVVDPVVLTPPRPGGGTNRPGPRPEGHKRRPPRKRKEKVRKLKDKWGRLVDAAGNIKGGFSEFMDLMDALYKAIPPRLRTQSFHDGQRVRPSWKKRWNDIHQNWDSIDWNKAAKNWIANEIDDQIVGRLGKGVGNLSNQTGTYIPGVSRADSGWLPDSYSRGTDDTGEAWSFGDWATGKAWSLFK